MNSIFDALPDSMEDFLNDSSPMEHLTKILQNASTQAIENSIDTLFERYAIMSMILESSKIDVNAKIEQLRQESDFKENLKEAKNDLAIDVMSSILSQE